MALDTSNPPKGGSGFPSKSLDCEIIVSLERIATSLEELNKILVRINHALWTEAHSR